MHMAPTDLYTVSFRYHYRYVGTFFIIAQSINIHLSEQTICTTATSHWPLSLFLRLISFL
jgi:hypothetical protein